MARTTQLVGRSRRVRPTGIGSAPYLRTVLDWHSARSAHRSDLSVFRCTDPGTVTFDEESGFACHDYPWEFEVQEHINSLHPPLHPPYFLLVGYDNVGLAAVIEMRVWEFDRHCFVNALAVAHRVSGNGLAGEALDLARRVLEKYGITSDYVIEGLVDVDNWAAKSVFGRRGFVHVEMRDGYEVWAQKFD